MNNRACFKPVCCEQSLCGGSELLLSLSFMSKKRHLAQDLAATLRRGDSGTRGSLLGRRMCSVSCWARVYLTTAYSNIKCDSSSEPNKVGAMQRMQVAAKTMRLPARGASFVDVALPKLNDREFCSSSFECVPSPTASTWTPSEANNSRMSHNCSELRVFGRHIGRIGDRPYRPQLWGYRHITCPCGVYCPWGYYFAGLRRVCRGTVQCAPCR